MTTSNYTTKSLETPKRDSLWQRIFRARWAYIFIAPFFITFAIFGLYPLGFSIYLSFTEWKGLGPIKWVGFGNYARLFQDPLFWQSVRNGVIIFFMHVPLMVLLSLVLAVLLNSKRVRGFQFFRTVIFVPYITNMVAAGFAFRLLLEQENGLVNILLGTLGIPAIPWLESVWGARVSLTLLILWHYLGYNMVIMLAGLQTIPKEIYDASLVDGATRAQSFLYITLPMMRPVILFVVVLSTMGSFDLFTEIYTLTGGGPINATITPILSIFNQAFSNFRLGYASAMSYVYFVMIIALTLIQLRYFRTRE
jgi:lactose/L-arabinose transport system permease protein